MFFVVQFKGSDEMFVIFVEEGSLIPEEAEGDKIERVITFFSTRTKAERYCCGLIG